jgi:hypothetical protein
VANAEEKEEQQEAVELLDTTLDDERREEEKIVPNPTDPTQLILTEGLESVYNENLTLHSLHTLHNSTLKVGDKVEYIGTDKSLVKQYSGILTVHSLQYDSCSCMKPGGQGLTSWIEFVELRLVGGWS